MISIKEVEEIHKTLVDTFGGSHGIRDMLALASALARPFQTFDRVDLHPTPLHKAASLIESILINHPFIDGNKRTGYRLVTRKTQDRVLRLWGLLFSNKNHTSFELFTF